MITESCLVQNVNNAKNEKCCLGGRCGIQNKSGESGKKEGNGHGETSVSLSISPVSLSISPVLSHGKFLWKPNYHLSGLKYHLGKQKVFFFHGNMKGIEMLIASE